MSDEIEPLLPPRTKTCLPGLVRQPASRETRSGAHTSGSPQQQQLSAKAPALLRRRSSPPSATGAVVAGFTAATRTARQRTPLHGPAEAAAGRATTGAAARVSGAAPSSSDDARLTLLLSPSTRLSLCARPCADCGSQQPQQHLPAPRRALVRAVGQMSQFCSGRDVKFESEAAMSDQIRRPLGTRSEAEWL
jgi:hypothetical protein